tara:strand:+ start:192 stop:485 length:294 start_codon:yes stop_codon:yes gene_type:complete
MSSQIILSVLFAPIILSVLFISSLAFIYFNDKKNQKAEVERFREAVRAIKSQDLDSYSDSIPIEGKISVAPPEDEIVELDQVPPEELIQAIKQNDNQ